MKTLNDDVQMRLTGCCRFAMAGAFEGRRWHKTASDPKARNAFEQGLTGLDQSRRCGARPVFRHGHNRRRGKKLGRHFIGIENEAAYVQAAKARISKIKPLDDESLEVVQSAKQQKRIPFGALVESGMLKPGTVFWSGTQGAGARAR